MDTMALDEVDHRHRHKSRRKEMQDTIHDRGKANKQEMRELREEIRAKERQVEAKEQEIRELREEIRELREEIRELREEIRELREEMKGVEREIAIASGTEVVKPLEAKLQFLRQEINSIRQEISSRDQQINILRQEIISIQLSAGGEKGSTSEPVLAVVETIQRLSAEQSQKLDRMSAEQDQKMDRISAEQAQKMDRISALVQESFSRTRAASTMNMDDLRVLRTCLGIVALPEEGDVTLKVLLGAESPGGEPFWDTYELQLKDKYIQEFKDITKLWDVLWTDANATKIKRRFPSVEFPVVAKNDLVLSLRRFESLITLGAILGVEIKKKLSWRGLRQAEAEFYVWATESQFPFVQLITDMEVGGVAIYSHGGRDIRFRTLGSMGAVRDFVSDLVKFLPPGAGEDDSEGKVINPNTFPSPSRKRLSSSNLEMSSANPQVGCSSIDRQMAIWSMLAAYNNNLGDVANLQDLDCFDIEPVH